MGRQATEFDRVAAFLGDPATHGGAAVEVIRTHAALVFLAGDTAWKVKRPVVYDYLDFSAPETRRAMLAREITLNGPSAPEIYGELVPVTEEPGGGLALGGTGRAVEWALRMRRFPAEAELSQVAARGALTPALAARLGAEVAAYHAAAPRREAEGPELIAEILAELARVFRTTPEAIPPEAAAAFDRRAAAHLDRVAGLLRRRAAAGWVRRCHGDLHLRNLVLVGDRPVPFDALEFDERLGTMDVLYDLAFLLMDLHHAGLDAAANAVLNRWLTHLGAPDHLDALAALPLFLAVRAAIRAMVAGQRAAGSAAASDAVAEARDYMAAARAYLAPPPARMVAVGGFSGSGKTTLAAALAPGIGPVPGAVHLRSDLIRKELAGVAETDRLPPERYTQAASDAVYAELRARAAQALAAGHGVVLDAVHLTEAERAASARVAQVAGVAFAGLWLDAAPAVLMARVDARQADASDADAAVVRRQIARAGAVADWTVIDASGSPDATLAAARAVI
jgi:aminoglycoside phosphotransferase family enzyme/predicted kinase